ncbi:hypothetical protein [Burkholderia sp. PU8-34]
MDLTAIKRHMYVNLESYLIGFTPDVLFKRRPGLIAGMPPGNLNHVFFTMGGSDVVDTALKMEVGFHRIKGDATRFRIIGRKRGYHGVGLGGVTAGGVVADRKTFTTMIPPGVDHLSHTHSDARHGLLQGPAHVGHASRI